MAGGPEFPFPLDTRASVWTDAAPNIYRQAVASQWDPATAVDWDAPFELADDVEEAVVQVHFLLSVLGEGTFLHLLSFLERHAPDPVTARVCHLALADEVRHVAFGMVHLASVLDADPGLRARLAATIHHRHDALAQTAGLNREVFDGLVVLAAGSWTPSAVGGGFARGQELNAEMDDGRRRRLVKLGFPPQKAAGLASLHTRNFM